MKKYNLITTLVLFFATTILLNAQQVQKNFVVVEIGTYTTCPNCPGAAKGADELVANGHQVAIIENHQNDYFSNVGSESRNAYYEISGYPTANFDGIYEYAGGSSNSMYVAYLPNYNSAIDIMSDFTLDMTYSNTCSGYNVTIEITEPGDYVGENLVVHLVLTECIDYSWYDLDELNYINRKMYPSKDGTSFSGGNQTINLSITPQDVLDLDRCELVAFIQDNDTKQILQSNKISLETPVMGENNAFLISIEEIITSCEPEPITPIIRVKNKGTSDITSMTFYYDINNGETTGTYNWTGEAIHSLDFAEIEFDEINFDLQTSNLLNIEITEVNGTTDDEPTNNIRCINFNAPQATTHLFLELQTDGYGYDCSWEIINSAGITVQNGSSYGSNQTIQEDFIIPADCNTFYLYDAWGDGGTEATLQDSEGTLLFYTDGDFDAEISQAFATEIAENITEIVDKINIYPNPVTDILFINTNFNQTFDIEIFNTMGKLVYKRNNIETNNLKIDVRDFYSGIYFIKINTEKNTKTNKIIIK